MQLLLHIFHEKKIKKQIKRNKKQKKSELRLSSSFSTLNSFPEGTGTWTQRSFINTPYFSDFYRVFFNINFVKFHIKFKIRILDPNFGEYRDSWNPTNLKSSSRTYVLWKYGNKILLAMHSLQIWIRHHLPWVSNLSRFDLTCKWRRDFYLVGLSNQQNFGSLLVSRHHLGYIMRKGCC